MISATLELQTIPAIPTLQVFTHIVTLLNRRTGDEQSLQFETLSDRFADVMREICHLKVMHNLQGFEVFEILDCNSPF